MGYFSYFVVKNYAVYGTGGTPILWCKAPSMPATWIRKINFFLKSNLFLSIFELASAAPPSLGSFYIVVQSTLPCKQQELKTFIYFLKGTLSLSIFSLVAADPRAGGTPILWREAPFNTSK